MTTFDDLMQFPQGKLTHPLIAQWALERITDQPEGSPRRAAMVDAWFHDLTLGHWLASDDEDIHFSLLLYIPSERLAGFVPALEKLWHEFQYAHLAARHLVKLAPERAAELFRKAVASSTPLDKALAILGHIPALDEETRRFCLDGLLRQLDETGDEGISNWGIPESVFICHRSSPTI